MRHEDHGNRWRESFMIWPALVMFTIAAVVGVMAWKKK
jgi:hypothetical protein